MAEGLCWYEHAKAIWAVFWIDEVCYRWNVFDWQMTRQNILDLNWQHVEADNGSVLHVKHMLELVFQPPNIFVNCNYTDVLTKWFYTQKGFVWMDAELDRKNTSRYVDLTKLSVSQNNMLSFTSGTCFNWIWLYICIFGVKAKVTQLVI